MLKIWANKTSLIQIIKGHIVGIKKKGAYVDWNDPDNVVLLLTKDLHWLADHFQTTYNSISSTKTRILKKIKNGGLTLERQPGSGSDAEKFRHLLERNGIDPEDVDKIKELRVWQGFIKNSDGEIEYADLASATLVPKGQEDDYSIYPEVAPAKITPTKRKRAERLARLILVYGDGQVGFRRVIDPRTQEQELLPLHSEAQHNIIKQINADWQPETVVNLGDFADFPEPGFTRFDPQDDHFHKTLTMTMQYIHDFYSQLRADNPNGDLVEVDSNHAIRPRKAILKNLPGYYDFYRPGEDYPAGSYYSMAKLGEMGVRFFSGYGAAEFVYGDEYDAPPIVFKHGNHSSSAPGATVRKEMQQNPEVNIVRGHGHKDEEVWHTTRQGWQLFYRQLGSSCLNRSNVPGYNSAIDDFNKPVNNQQDHQNTLLIIEDYQNGHYTLNTLNVMDGVTYFRDKEYNGNEE